MQGQSHRDSMARSGVASHCRPYLRGQKGTISTPGAGICVSDHGRSESKTASRTLCISSSERVRRLLRTSLRDGADTVAEGWSFRPSPCAYCELDEAFCIPCCAFIAEDQILGCPGVGFNSLNFLISQLFRKCGKSARGYHFLTFCSRVFLPEKYLRIVAERSYDERNCAHLQYRMRISELFSAAVCQSYEVIGALLRADGDEHVPFPERCPLIRPEYVLCTALYGHDEHAAVAPQPHIP